MSQLPFALQLLVLIVSGWVNRRQQLAIEYLLEENRVLREQLGNRRLRLTDAQRRRLAVRGKALGRKALDELAGVVTPATILRWYRTPRDPAERGPLASVRSRIRRALPRGEATPGARERAHHAAGEGTGAQCSPSASRATRRHPQPLPSPRRVEREQPLCHAQQAPRPEAIRPVPTCAHP